MSVTHFTVEIDRKGFTIEGLEAFSVKDLKKIIEVVPAAVKAVREEDKKRRVCKKLLELEGKELWTAKESIFYAYYSPKREAINTACDRFNLFKEMEVAGL
jgi:hypothetical protein